MKEKLGQEPAFSVAAFGDGEGVWEKGMSKRFYAACAAMQGILSSWNPYSMPEGNEIKLTIRTSYELADELLKQENQEQ